MKTFNEFLQEATNEDKLIEYISSKMRAHGSDVIGKVYLMKSPNGKPMLYYTEKIFKSQSIFYFGTLEYKKIAGEMEWVIDWMVKKSTGRISNASIVAIAREAAVKMLNSLGIPGADKIPKTAERVIKEVPEYEVVK